MPVVQKNLVSPIFLFFMLFVAVEGTHAAEHHTTLTHLNLLTLTITSKMHSAIELKRGLILHLLLFLVPFTRFLSYKTF